MDFKTRLSFDFPKNKILQLEKIQGMGKFYSNSDIINEALNLYMDYMEVLEDSKEFLYNRKNSKGENISIVLRKQV